MNSYFIPLKMVKKNDVLNRKNSLSASSFKEINVLNKNFEILGELLEGKAIKGFEPGSDQYIGFSENNFIRIQDMERLEFTFKENDSTIKIIPPKESYKKRIIINGDICYQTASDVGNVCIYVGNKSFYNSHIRKLNIKKDKYYVFAFLKSELGKGQINISGSIKGVDNFSEELLLNTKIFFPTDKNNPYPEQVKTLVSVIVQNIINKEQEIRKKIFLIDEIFKTELINSFDINKFKYSFPRLKDLKKIKRLDNKLYSKDFKKFENYLENYSYGYTLFKTLKQKNIIKSRKGPNLAISIIGKSIYTDIKNKNLIPLILSKNVSDAGIIKKITYLGNNSNLPLLKKFDLLLFARGDIGRVLFIDDFLINSTSNFDVFFIDYKSKLTDKLFLLNYLRFLKNQNYWAFFSVGGSGALSLTDDLLQRLKIPNFPESKKIDISKLYYNEVKKNKLINLDDYIEKEFKRNETLGVFQLSIEIFKLKKLLEELIFKIANNQKIEINQIIELD